MMDLIYREALLEAIEVNEILGKQFFRGIDFPLSVCFDAIRDSIKDAEAIAIVTCNECKYASITDSGECKYCKKWEEIYNACERLYLDGNFHCGFGERKEANESI